MNSRSESALATALPEHGDMLETDLDVDGKDPGTLIDLATAFVRFEVAGELFAMPLAAIREVAVTGPATLIPRAPPCALGLMNHAGRVYTLLDPMSLFRDDAPRPRQRALLLDVPSRSLGLCVDRVMGIGRLTVEDGWARDDEERLRVLSLESIVEKVDSAFLAASVLESRPWGSAQQGDLDAETCSRGR